MNKLALVSLLFLGCKAEDIEALNRQIVTDSVKICLLSGCSDKDRNWSLCGHFEYAENGQIYYFESDCERKWVRDMNNLAIIKKYYDGGQ